MYKISRIVDPSIFPNITFIISLISILYAIPYSSAAKILRITRLHFIIDQYIIFALLIVSTR